MQKQALTATKNRANARARDRIAFENMRRDFWASSVLLAVVSILWIQYLIGGYIPITVVPDWVLMIIYAVNNLIFMLLTYRSVMLRKRRRIREVNRLFWLIQYLTIALLSIFAPNELEAQLEVVVFMAVLALVPLFEFKEVMVTLGFETVLLIMHIGLSTLGAEHLVNAFLIMILCAIISVQFYHAYQRKETDATVISSAKNQAETDPMTKLLNRRGLERRVMQVWPASIRERLSAAVIMLDIDNFKKFNDTFGHGEGDECIKMIAGALSSVVVRPCDYVARVGGEEFLILLNGLTEKEAIDMAVMSKKAVEERKMPHAPGNFLPYVTVSMGLSFAEAVVPEVDFWELRNEADKALYQAKEAGKACVYYNNVCYDKVEGARNVKQYMRDRAFHSAI